MNPVCTLGRLTADQEKVLGWLGVGQTGSEFALRLSLTDSLHSAHRELSDDQIEAIVDDEVEGVKNAASQASVDTLTLGLTSLFGNTRAAAATPKNNNVTPDAGANDTQSKPMFGSVGDIIDRLIAAFKEFDDLINSELSDWLQLGNSAFPDSGALDEFYASKPNLNKFRDAAEAGSPLPAIRQEFQNVIQQAGSSFTVSSGQAPITANDLDVGALDLIQQAKSATSDRSKALADKLQEAARADDDLAAANNDLAHITAAHDVAAPINIPDIQLRSLIPGDWVVCQCPADHPNAGLVIDGVRWHSAAILCPH